MKFDDRKDVTKIYDVLRSLRFMDLHWLSYYYYYYYYYYQIYHNGRHTQKAKPVRGVSHKKRTLQLQKYTTNK